MEEAIGHLINFVKFSGNPRATLMTLQQTLPPPIFNLLIRAVTATSGPSAAQGRTGEAVEVD
jgi:hypothetical protein